MRVSGVSHNRLVAGKTARCSDRVVEFPGNQGRESQGKGAGGDRKAPNEAKFVRTLVLGRLHLRTNQDGIWQAKQTQFPAGGYET